MKKIAQILNRFLGLFGLRLSRTKSIANYSLEFGPVFSRLQERDIPILTAIDIGASNGCWSDKLRKYYPDSHYHLIEANVIHEPGLKEFVSRCSNSSFTIAAAADSVGEVYFDDENAWGGVAAHQETETATRKIRCTTIDEEVSRNGLHGPFLIKLDTHGFEVPILQGAEHALQQTNIIVLEAYNFHLTDQSLTFWEMCEYLYERGFRPIDLLEPMHRPKDGAFWQLDIVFLKADRPEFHDNQYA